MKIIVTGATGNLGIEVVQVLLKKGHDVFPLVRPSNESEARERLESIYGESAHLLKTVLVADLENSKDLSFPRVDGLVHCAGFVRFNEGGRNVRMTTTALRAAEAASIPFYHISTAFIDGVKGGMRNAYETDKSEAEAVVRSAKVPFAIFRPSMLTGNSKTGAIKNFSGYYLVIKAFFKLLKRFPVPTIRFLKLMGNVDILPINVAGEMIVQAIENNARGVHYITNPSPPEAHWLLSKSLEIVGVDNCLSFLECSAKTYADMNLRSKERYLFEYLKPFLQYWTESRRHPASQAHADVAFTVDEAYLRRILTYAINRNWE